MKSLLTPRQNSLLRILLALGGFMAASSIFLYLRPPGEGGLTPTYQWMLLGHVFVGLLLLLPMIVFILWHFTVVLQRKHPFAVWTGVAIAAAAVMLAVTGLWILEEANSTANRVHHLTHVILGLAIPASYVLHRVSAEQRPTLLRLGVGVGAVLGLAAVMAGFDHADRPETVVPGRPFARVGHPPDDGDGDPFVPFRTETIVAEAHPGSLFYPSPARTTDDGYLHPSALTLGDVPDRDAIRSEVEEKGFVSDLVIGAETCRRCHPDTVAQWEQSAHRFSSFNNPFYRASILDMREAENGMAKSKWCAGCHDPAVLYPGKMDPSRVAEPFNADLPDAQAGLTCMACHAIEEIHSVGGNGGYTIRDGMESPYLFAGVRDGPGVALHDLLVRSKPATHKRDMLPPILRTSEFCATCHKVSLQEPVNDYRWLRGQQDYDSWHDSGIARNNPETFYLRQDALACQDCHMPLEDAPLGDVAAKDGKVRSHRFYGINTALPAVRGDQDMVRRTEAFLKDSLRVDVFGLVRADGTTHRALDLDPPPLREGETAQVQVVVRSLKVGHIFPAGTLDSNQGWLHVEVFDDAGTLIFESGGLEPDGTLGPGAHTYGATIVDREGARIDRRNAKDIFTVAQANVVPPGGADLGRYALTVPEGYAGRSLRVRARLRFRKFRRDYTEFSFRGRPVPVLPITDIATAEVVLPVVARDAAIPTPGAPETLPGDGWTRWNDYGIALMRQSQSGPAEDAFAEVDRLRPDLPDGPRNVARIKLSVGAYGKAEQLLREADARAPGDPRVAYWFGRLHLGRGDNERAIAALERSAEEFPESRAIRTHLFSARWALRDYAGSLAEALRHLEIDPESETAHHHRRLAYAALGEEDAAGAAEDAFERYKTDENAPVATERYLNDPANAPVLRETQRIHVHELRPPE